MCAEVWLSLGVKCTDLKLLLDGFHNVLSVYLENEWPVGRMWIPERGKEKYRERETGTSQNCVLEA